MTSTQEQKALTTLLNKLGRAYPDHAEPLAPVEPIDENGPVLTEFIRAFLHWNAAAARADATLRRIATSVVDFNELRVCLADELTTLFGSRYPKADERALRLKLALTDLYKREHTVSLEHLLETSKREARQFLESLEGCPRYVAARVTLVSLGGHAAPVDDRIHTKLAAAGIPSLAEDPDRSCASLERLIRAGELLPAYTALQAWADAPSDGDAALEPAKKTTPRKRVAKKTPAKRTTRKR